MVLTNSSRKISRFVSVRAFVVCSVVLLALVPSRGAAPRINYIDRWDTNKVRIHFDTEPNRTYILQYANSLAATNWSNLYTALSFPISSHYIIVDTRSTPTRIYRLKVTP